MSHEKNFAVLFGVQLCFRQHLLLLQVLLTKMIALCVIRRPVGEGGS